MKNVVVTGGGGFVGRAIVALLKEEGLFPTVLGRSPYPDLAASGIRCLKGDIADYLFVQEALRGADTVFHVAAKAGVWGGFDSYYQTNVVGTENVIKACYATGVTALVYTSTPSVVFVSRDIEGGNESLPYAQKFLCHYAHTKSIAEKMVLENISDTLHCCAIRPHLVWGPGDPHLFPRIIERGKQGQLSIVGDGENLVDISYVDNVAHAHILAAKNLHTSAEANGRSYFIGQERPVNLFDWLNEIFQQLEIRPVKKRVSFAAAYGIGWILEKIHAAVMPEKEPKMTRFLAQQLAKSHYFSHENAQKDLGYTPQISIEEGMARLIQWLRR